MVFKKQFFRIYMNKFFCINYIIRKVNIHITTSTNAHFFLATPDAFYNPSLTFLPYPKMFLNDFFHQGERAHEQ